MRWRATNLYLNGEPVYDKSPPIPGGLLIKIFILIIALPIFAVYEITSKIFNPSSEIQLAILLIFIPIFCIIAYKLYRIYEENTYL